jgi:hypothetical protein
MNFNGHRFTPNIYLKWLNTFPKFVRSSSAIPAGDWEWLCYRRFSNHFFFFLVRLYKGIFVLLINFYNYFYIFADRKRDIDNILKLKDIDNKVIYILFSFFFFLVRVNPKKLSSRPKSLARGIKP